MGKFGDAAEFGLSAVPLVTGLLDRFMFLRDPLRRSVEQRILGDLNFQTGFDPESGRFNQGNPLGDPLSGFGGQFGTDEAGNPFTPQQAQLRFLVEQLNAQENAQTRGINAFGDIGNRFGGAGAGFATDFQNPQTQAVAPEQRIPGIIQENRPIPEPLEPSRVPGEGQVFQNFREQVQNSGVLEDALRQRFPVTQEGQSFQQGTPFVNPPLGQEKVNVQVDAGEAIIPKDQNLGLGAKPLGGLQFQPQSQVGGSLGFQGSGDILNQVQGQALNPQQPAGLDQLTQQALNPQQNVGLQGAQDVFGQGFGNVAGQQNLNQLAGGGQASLVGDILQNPTGFNQQTQTDIFNIGKNQLDAETAALQRQLAGGAAQSGALGTGQFGQQSLGLETSRLGQLADFQRRIGIDAAQRQFQNQLSAAQLQQGDIGRQFGQQLGASQFDLSRLGQQGQGLLQAGGLENQIGQGQFGNLLNTVGLQQGIGQQNFQNLFDTAGLTEGVTQGQFGREIGVQDRITALDQAGQQRQADLLGQLAQAEFTVQDLQQLGLGNLLQVGQFPFGGAPA